MLEIGVWAQTPKLTAVSHCKISLENLRIKVENSNFLLNGQNTLVWHFSRLILQCEKNILGILCLKPYFKHVIQR